MGDRPQAPPPARSGPGSARAQPAPLGHIPALDGLRGVAVLLVVQLHSLVLERRTGADQVFFRVCGAGWVGVDLFFVLSGFLITGVLLDQQGRPGCLRNFFARRLVRIFPLYYGFLLAYFVVLPRLGIGYFQEKVAPESSAQAPLWLYYFNFWSGLSGVRPWSLEVFWSLCVEEHFYLVWPFVVVACRRRTLALVCAAVAALALAARVGLIAAGATMWEVYVLTPGRLDGLCIGAGVSLLVRAPVPRAVLLRCSRAFGAAAALFVLGLAWGQGHFFDWVEPGSPEGLADSRGVLTVGLTALDVAFGCLLVSVVTAGPASPLRRFLEVPLLREVGRYSYALYVLHYLIRNALKDLIYGPSQFAVAWGSQLPGQLLFTLLMLGSSVLAAALSWHLYEKHFLRLKAFFGSRGAGG
jgi:peptidoglycan/LPS O-acetylase OafA/YrhL